ncbi:MAG: formate dehydrogenase accessory protein FdhE [Alphaproteobacteria bacterium]|nr:formate dehydrogenase accessory protein FdhE [Alphaproteobacteria bacterium]
MSGGSVVPIEEIGNIRPPPFVRLPDLVTVFVRRAERLEKLAPGHVLEGWLRFMAALSRAQHEALRRLPPGSMPGPDEIAAAREAQRPALESEHWQGDATWPAALDEILRIMAAVNKPAAAEAARASLAALDTEERAALVSRYLSFELGAGERGAAPYVAAALQLYWTRMAALLDPAAVGLRDDKTACPICGGPPVASVVSGAEGDSRSLRYLCCGLCQTQWNEVRIKCTACGSTKGIAYHHVDQGGTATDEPPARDTGERAKNGGPTVRAETCDECKTYLKILYREKDVGADPVADDLATLELDILASEAGYHRTAPNPFLILGET